MAAGQDEDKTEQATPFKLEEARRQGQVAKSPDLVSLLVLGVVLISVFAAGGWATRQSLEMASRLLISSGQVSIEPAQVLFIGRWVSEQVLQILAPLLILVVCAAVIANLVISGPVFSFKPLSPQVSRLNPAQGLKRVFSLRTLYETGKTIFKLALIMVAVYLSITALMPKLLQLPSAQPRQLPDELISLGGATLFAILGALVLVALMDVAFTQWEFRRQMRMSRRELKDEIRRREGDPQIKSKRRQLLASLQKKNQSMGRVKDATLVLINPAHLAVALQYQRGTMPAPRVLAKGIGEQARQIRSIAFRHRIPVVQDVALTRRLYELDLDVYIPEEEFESVAAAIRSTWGTGR